MSTAADVTIERVVALQATDVDSGASVSNLQKAVNDNAAAAAAALAGSLQKSSNLSDVAVRQTALNNLAGTQSSGKYLRSDGTNTSLSNIQAADVPTLNQNTTGTAAGLSSTLAIASGGTNATSANAAFNNLAPSQTSAAGKFLTSDGTNTSWVTVSATATDSYAAKSANYTLTSSDKTVGFTTGSSALVATLPTAVGNSGLVLRVIKVDTGTGTVAINTTSAQTIGARASGAIILRRQGNHIVVQSDGANWQILAKDEYEFLSGSGSSNYSGFADGTYRAVSGNNIAPTAGRWRIRAIFEVATGSAGANNGVYANTGIYNTAGADSSTQPTAAPNIVSGAATYTDAGLNHPALFTGSNIYVVCGQVEIIVELTTSTNYYAVPQIAVGTASNAAVRVLIEATRIW